MKARVISVSNHQSHRQSRDTFASLKKNCRLYGLLFRDCLTDRQTGIRLLPRLGEVIEKASSLVAVRPAKSQCMGLCQCLGLVIATSASDLLASMLELPLFFPCASPDKVLSPHWRAIVDEPVVPFSWLSGDRPGSAWHSGNDRASTSLCIEPDTTELSQETGFPGCLPLPEGSESVLVSIADDRPNHQQAAWTLPVSKRVLPVNTTISGTSEETSVLLLPCDQEPCVAWNYGDRVSLLDLAEMTLPEEAGTAERKTRKVREVVQTRDQNGNIIYQWYDQDGHLHIISEWEFKRWLSMYFQSLLEFLYPEYFGSSTPAGGGWHQWQYWKVRRTADRPENTGQQRWSARQTQHQPNGQTARPVAAVQPEQQIRFTKYQSRHQNSWPQPSPSGKAIGKTVENEIDRLLMEFTSGHMQSVAARYKKNYDGRKHGQYCNQIKNATRTRRKPLTDDEKLRFVPFMRHLSEVVYSFNETSLSVCVHSLVASQLLYPPRSTQGQRTVLGGEGESVKKAQKALIEQLVRAVESRTTLHGFDAQAISNLLWALAKLVENGLLQLVQGGLASQAVTVLLPQVVTPPESFKPQEISNLLWALAKLAENGLPRLDQGDLASQAVMALLPQVLSLPGSFHSQYVSNLLWALAKLVENDLLQLGQADLASQAVTALLLQVLSFPGPFKPQEISNLLWALAKLVESGLLQLDQGGLASLAVTALLPQVQSYQNDFTSQHVSNLLWVLAKLVENGLLQLNQGGLISQAVTALLPQVQNHQEDFISQHISNLLWALAKLVENKLFQPDRGGLANQAVMALLPQVQNHQDDFTSQGVSNLLWALTKLVDNGLLQLDQGGLVSQTVTALLSQVMTPLEPFKPKEISNLLWALAVLGDGVSLYEVLHILRTMDINTIELWRDQVITLWALTVFLARGGETSLLLPPMRRLYDALMAKKGNNSGIRDSIMRLSGIWLEENPGDLPLPNYETIISHSQRKLHAILRGKFPRHTLEMEVSANGLPPVDLLFPHEKVVVEVQGTQHYLDKKKTLRNGSTILKTSTYKKLRYKVFEIPASDVTNLEKQKQLLRELDACFLNGGNSAENSTESDYETIRKDDWFPADEKP